MTILQDLGIGGSIYTFWIVLEKKSFVTID